MIFQSGCGTLGPNLFRVPRSPMPPNCDYELQGYAFLHPISSFPKKIIKKEQYRDT